MMTRVGKERVRERERKAVPVPSWVTMGEVYEERKGAHTEKWDLKGECREGMQTNKKSRRR